MIRPGCTLGILGGGQLGRMIAMAAAQLGLKTHIYAPEENSPAFEVATEITIAAYEDEATLVRFAKAGRRGDLRVRECAERDRRDLKRPCPARPQRPGAGGLAGPVPGKELHRGPRASHVAPFAPFRDEAELAAALERIGRPAVLKTRRFGYDGKGQVDDPARDRPRRRLGRASAAPPAILEGFVPFEREVSVVAARTASGAFAAYDLCANEHRHHILDTTQVPAGVSDATDEQAVAHRPVHRRGARLCRRPRGRAVPGDRGRRERLVVNEIAPRVHNSGHWTWRRRDLAVRAACPRRLRLAARRRPPGSAGSR